jgi:hypothetical protein
MSALGGGDRPNSYSRGLAPTNSGDEEKNTYVGFEVLTAVIMNISPPSSGLNKPITIPARNHVPELATCFHRGILLRLFDPEDGGDMFLRNVGWLSTDYMTLYPRKILALLAINLSYIP